MKLFLSLYFFLLPFQWALSPTEGIDLALIRPVTLVLGLFWLVIGCFSRNIRLPLSKEVFYFSSFLLLVSLSYLWASHPELALRKILFVLSFAPLYFVLLDFFHDSKGRYRILEAFVYGAVAAALVGIGIFLSQFIFGVETVFSFLTTKILPIFLGQSFGQAVAEYPSLLVNVGGKTLLRASGVFPDPHMFSFYVGMAMPLVLPLFFQAKVSQRRNWLFILGTLFLADLLSFSRGGYIGLLAASLLWLVASGQILRLRSKGAFQAGIAVIIVFGSLLLTPFPSRFVSSFSQQDGSNMERLRLWQEALGHIADKPFFGVGLGNYPLVVKPSASFREPIYAHNLYLDIAAEIGLMGLGFFLLLLFSAGIHAWQLWKRQGDLVGLAALLSLGVFSAHSLFESPLYSVHIFPVLLLFLALGNSQSVNQKK